MNKLTLNQDGSISGEVPNVQRVAIENVLDLVHFERTADANGVTIHFNFIHDGSFTLVFTSDGRFSSARGFHVSAVVGNNGVLTLSANPK